MASPRRPSVEPITPMPERGEPSNTRRGDTRQPSPQISEISHDPRERERTPTNGQERPSEGHNSPVRDALDIELEELEAWREKTAKLQRVAQLRQAQARYLAGDQTALRTVIEGAPSHSSILNVPAAKLPTPKAPHTFTKRTRLEFNCWTRDCERYFTMIPANFARSDRLQG